MLKLDIVRRPAPRSDFKEMRWTADDAQERRIVG
jgi:hypothetical protein